MKDQVFGVLQRIGRSFMLPIALLPAAGLLLGIGGSFSNVTMRMCSQSATVPKRSLLECLQDSRTVRCSVYLTRRFSVTMLNPTITAISFISFMVAWLLLPRRVIPL